MPNNAFISYAHADEKHLERLHKHLAMLRRDGRLQAWSDHAIIPGDNVGQTISAALDQSSLFIALVSPDYLNSNYCYEKEFQRALQLQAEGRLRIVAVILEPCDWLNSPFSQILVLPKDGKPVSEWTNENTAYLNAVEGIRRALAATPSPGPDVAAEGTGATATGTARRVRVKQQFDAIQKAEYAEAAFRTIQTYFQNACAELHEASDQIRARFELMGPNAFTCTVVNRALMRNGEAHITVRHARGGRMHVGDLSFVYQPHADDGTSNGWMSVEADDYNLFLNAMIDGLGRSRDEKVTPEQAAERLWNNFVTQAGIEYE
ncbi:hypothetical protein ABID82_006920 [Methylobacterium sp. PvP062]|jgi:hypothetical protein|uniref:TIR domain-containing protein n=1 Tax=Methylobacterium radiotolerans TaxID=31998 RepID=A0ABV2N8B0_9HYPH|nr:MULTISPECIES: toll/interleukin-1 receptor domain-containing protein [unclassified Methylobacterium]MBP2498205.1 hypothetical protein [Methylobacterium sp. PvP105]MBP2506387.1 hypothetical protein [Methylobacterium sp. PvP109]